MANTRCLGKSACFAIVIAAAATVILQTQLLAQLPNQVIPNMIGVVDHRGESTAVYSTMHNIGIRYQRIDLWWPNVESSPGVYDFSGYDGLVQSTQAAGIKIMFILDYSNPLYDSGYSPYDAAGDTAYANFALAAVQHYQNLGLVWEIYNEPSLSWTSPNTNITEQDIAQQYSAMANAAEQAIKASFPNELVIGPAMAAAASSDSLNFLDTLYQNGVADNLDAISVHPYRNNYPESVSSDYAVLRAQIESNTSNNPPLANSEWGYTSCYFYNNSECFAAGYGDGGPLTFSQAETLKGKFVARMLLADRLNGIPFSIVYDWMNDGTDRGNPEDNFGLVGNYPDHGTPTQFLPAYYALRTFTSVLNGYWFSHQINTGNPIDQILAFTNGRRNIYVCWADAGPYGEYTTGGGNTVNIPIGRRVSVTVTSYDGNSVVKTTSGSNGYSCKETEGPQYISLTN